MQVESGENPRGSGKTRFGKFAFYTLFSFSLAGLIAGFAFGGFMGHFAGKMANLSNVPTIPHQPARTSPTGGSEGIAPGDPVLGSGDYTSPQKADGSTKYKLSAQIVYKNTHTPLTAPNVTCRLWLTSDADATATVLSADNYAIPRTIASFAQPFPDEISGALDFAAPSQQTQPCSTKGKTTWTYTLSPAVQPGNYYLAVLADWKGVHYNWYMVAIKVT